MGGGAGRVGEKERERERVSMNMERNNQLKYMHYVTDIKRNDLTPNMNLSCLSS